MVEKELNTKPLLSVFLVLKDEERHIDACLHSIQGCDAEVVVVHDGPCSDRTLDICRQYTPHVFVHDPPAFNNDPLIPFALKKTTGAWVLQMDGDERMSPDLKANIHEMIADPDVDCYALYFPFHDPETGEPTVSMRKYKKVLHRKSKLYKVGVPHAQSGCYGTEKRSEFALEHHEVSSRKASNMLRQVFRKNVMRSRVTAGLLCGPVEKIPVFNCRMDDNQLRIVRKLNFQRRHPLLALFLMPTYCFYDMYFRQKRWRWGGVGFVDSINVPLFHTRTCLCMLKLKILGRDHG